VEAAAMKDDVEIDPALPVPRKRRQLEAMLDRQLAVWLAREDLPAGDRRRVESEKMRRRHLQQDVHVGLLVESAGLTPIQREAVTASVAILPVTSYHWCHGDHDRLRKLSWTRATTYQSHETHREVVRHATVVIAAPKEAERPSGVQGVWDAVRFARHRGVPVTVVMPNGDER
jgi:hypothetical protein